MIIVRKYLYKIHVFVTEAVRSEAGGVLRIT